MTDSVAMTSCRIAAALTERLPSDGPWCALQRLRGAVPVQALIAPLSTAVAALLLVSATQLDFSDARWTRIAAPAAVAGGGTAVDFDDLSARLAAARRPSREGPLAPATVRRNGSDFDEVLAHPASPPLWALEESPAPAGSESGKLGADSRRQPRAGEETMAQHEHLAAKAPADAVNAEIECLAQNIYFEARSEPELGKLAVGQVVMNRVASKRFPGGICDVVRQGGESTLFRCQFSWWCDGKSDRPRNRKAWQRSLELARDIYWGRAEDPTEGALWYHADYVNPYWRKAFTQGPKIGRHIFYRAKTGTAHAQLAQAPKAD